MAERNFRRALPLVLKHEGGYVDHPKDPGGATNKGVTIGTFRSFVKPSGTKEDLRNITAAQVSTVYRRHYWDAVRASELPSGLDYAMFDFAVNSGPSRAIKFVQALVGAVVDGKIGPATMAAISTHDAAKLAANLCDARLAWLKKLRRGKMWETFGRGWGRRVAEVRVISLKWAAEGDPVQRVVQDAASPDRISTTEIAAGVTGLSGTVAAGRQVAEAVEGTRSTLDMVVAAGPWAVIVVMAAGGAWWIWRERRRKAREAREALA